MMFLKALHRQNSSTGPTPTSNAENVEAALQVFRKQKDEAKETVKSSFPKQIVVHQDASSKVVRYDMSEHSCECRLDGPG